MNTTICEDQEVGLMNTEEILRNTVKLDVKNIGGIEQTTVDISTGVTALTGRNATNRTSLLQAVMAALGSDQVSLKGDADEGRVEFTIGDTTYTRTLVRKNGTVTADGDPYLSDPTVADLFAFLLETNEARRAVARNEDLREHLMRPIDTEAIRTAIEQLETQQRKLSEDLNDLDELKGKLPDLETDLADLDSRIEDKRDELDDKEADLDAADRNVDETREEKAELDDKLDELRETRQRLEDVRYEVDTNEESLTALRKERTDLKAEQDTLPDAPAGKRSELDSRIDRLRDRQEESQTELTRLQNLIQFNEDMLGDDNIGHLSALRDDTDANANTDSSVTDQLLADDAITCWTCGTEVDKQRIDATLDQLRAQKRETFEEVSTIGDEIDELLAERNTLEDQQRERERVERRLARIDDEVDEHEATLEDLKNERDTLTNEIETLKTDVEQLENEEYSELLDIHKEANQLEFELRRLENDREEIVQEISEIENSLERRDQLENQRAELRDELKDLRTKIERIEAEAIENFNEHMETILDLLDYENIERIWLERIEREVREGRRKVEKSVFELHVVRTTRSGTAYEDTIEHLSESEREVTGLVFALAGYLVHDLHETVPVMLLDSLEAVDADRIATLIDYFEEYVDYLIIALLPEDATELDENYQRLTDI